MNNLQLSDMLKGYPVTICSADQIEKRRGRFYVSNTDTSDGPGSHWVTFYFPFRGPDEFFDSLGKDPIDYKVDFETFLRKRYWMMRDRIQQSTSETCGLYCVYYVTKRYRGMTMQNIVNSFNVNNPEWNDNYVREFVQKNNK